MYHNNILSALSWGKKAKEIRNKKQASEENKMIRNKAIEGK
jgi:hypothetical protein